jgi:hypothetical protein
MMTTLGTAVGLLIVLAASAQAEILPRPAPAAAPVANHSREARHVPETSV